MKKNLGLVAIAMTTSMGVMAKETEKEACMEILGAGIYNGILEDVCKFNGGVKEKLKAIYAAGECQSLVNADEINALSEEILVDTRNRFQIIGEEDFCNGNKEAYYALTDNKDNSSYSDVDIDSLKKYASDGDVTAQLRLGELYKKGKEVSQDYTLAALWYRKAAEAGNAEAQYSLAEMYSEGKGVPQDWELSENWYKQSAEQGNAKAQYAYAFFYYNYDHKSILNWFGDYYRNYNYKKAASWFEKAAKQDHPNALYFLGRMYEDGEGVEYNAEKAVQYFLKAANLGDSSSQRHIGKMHQDGEGNMEWDYEKAVFWLKKAALNGSDFAAEELGNIYSEGLEKPDYLYDGKNGIAKNQKEAVRWYLLAEKNGSSFVYGKLGYAYLEGKGVSQNYEEAAKWFHKDSVKGDFDSQYALANMYKEGKGIKKDNYKCYLWVTLAIEGVRNGVLKESPKGEKRLIDFTRTQKSCEKQISATEKKVGKELAEKYWDKYWSTPVGYLINIEL